MKKGYFITFEGTEGSGKTTQIKVAAEFFRKQGRRVLLLREPGGTQISEAIRGIILNKKFTQMKPETELLLYLAARAQILREKIFPALAKGGVVICDRFEDSTLAYQGFGRGIPLKMIERVSKLIVRGKFGPDLTIVLDIDPKVGMRRGGRRDRMERQSLVFHNKVRKGFLALVRKNPSRCAVLDASPPKNIVAKKVEEVLQRAFGKN